MFAETHLESVSWSVWVQLLALQFAGCVSSASDIAAVLCLSFPHQQIRDNESLCRVDYLMRLITQYNEIWHR